MWKTHLSTMQRGHTLSRELEQLREASVLEVQHDPVTGTFTRDTMLTILFRETDRVQRLDGALTLVVMDVDDFGHWNHHLGRGAGDQLLREVARRTGRALRSYDVLGRLGRDEFLIALPGCSVINAVELSERLRMDVFGGSFWVRTAEKEIVEVRLSACFGMAASRGRSPVIVMREAEQTLAQAKQLGPDSTQCAGDSAVFTETGPRRASLFTETDALLR
jgi:diguanylate cyclase (GGDEF)-like protein